MKADFRNATQMFKGGVYNSYLSKGESKYYYISASNVGYYLDIKTTGNTDTRCSLYDTDNNLIRLDDDSGEGLNCSIYILVSPGIYFIKVDGYNELEAGSYSLNIELEDL
jgi:hypothetical protein